MTTQKLILASGSRYRQQQLLTAGFDFEVVRPDVDESPLPDETPLTRANRLAYEKAQVGLIAHPDAVVIGADQVCTLDNQTLGKPGTIEAAIQQLQLLSNRTAMFHSAVAVVSRSQTRRFSMPTEVVVRKLTLPEIKRYVVLDEPLDSAGAFKSEQRGALLFERVTSNDPSALIGLPLIRLSAALREFGINPLG